MKFEKQSVDRLRFYPVVRKQRVEPGVSSYSRDIEGDLLSLFIVSPLNKFPMEADRIFEFTIAKLRMMGGIGAVVDVIQKKTVDLATAVSTENFRLDKAPHWYEVGPHADDSWDDNMRSFALTSFSVSEEATNLLNLSIEQADLSTQFLLMWLALECEVGKGPRAKQYFQNKKVGKRILQLFARLGTVRGDFAHNGKRVESPIAVQMLFLVFRLACINEPEQFELAKHHLNELAETVDF